MAAKATNASSVTTAFLLEPNRAGRNNTFTLQIIKQGGQDFLVKEGKVGETDYRNSKGS